MRSDLSEKMDNNVCYLRHAFIHPDLHSRYPYKIFINPGFTSSKRITDIVFFSCRYNINLKKKEFHTNELYHLKYYSKNNLNIKAPYKLDLLEAG